MRVTHILPFAVSVLMLSASVATAQAAAVSNEVATSAAPTDPLVPIAERTVAVAGPRLDQARVGIAVVHGASNGALLDVPQPAIARKKGVPQMIIGGAAILGGAIVGGDAGSIVGLAGLGYGLYGLYLYLQ